MEEKTYRGKEHSHLEIAKVIKLSDRAKRKEISEYTTQHRTMDTITVHAHTRTQITIDNGMCTRINWKIKYINEPVVGDK